MGVDPADEATLDRACDLGLAFQLANIARDIGEDDAAGRCYLPAEWLAEMDIPPGEHMKPPYRQRLAVLARRLADRAERYEACARTGAAALSVPLGLGGAGGGGHLRRHRPRGRAARASMPGIARVSTSKAGQTRLGRHRRAGRRRGGMRLPAVTRERACGRGRR